MSKAIEEGIYVVSLGNYDYTCLVDFQCQCKYAYTVRTSHHTSSLSP